MEELFSWLNRAGSEVGDTLHFLELLRVARVQMTVANPLSREMDGILKGERFAWTRVKQWPALYRHLRHEQDLLLEELYAFAAALPEKRCRTVRWKRFARCIQNPQVLESLKAELQASWESYLEEPLLVHEVTAETLVGHRLLVEGLHGWLEALELAPHQEEALARAIQANRLLLTLNHQARRLRARVQET